MKLLFDFLTLEVCDMRSKLATLLFVSLGTPCAFAANASFMGNEVGVTKCESAVKSLSDKARLEDNGISYYTEGKMYKGNASGLGLEGAQTITLICDKSNTLVVVQVIINKDYFQSYQKMLKAKYKQNKLINPYVGNRYAKYTQGNSTVTLNAPHLSFEMTLGYATNDFLKLMDSVDKKEKQSKDKYQQNAL